MILDCVQEHIRQVYAIPGHTMQRHVSINVVVSTLTNVVVTYYETDIHTFFDISIYSYIRVHNMGIKVIAYQR